MRRGALQALGHAFLLRHFRVLHAADFLALIEINDGETIEVRELDEHPARGAIGLLLERDRPNASVERQAPHFFLGLLLDYREPSARHRTADDILARAR